MIQMSERVRLVCGLALMLLCAAGFARLGMWQTERLAWKTQLIDALAFEESKPAETTPLVPRLGAPDATFARGYVEGVFVAATRRLVGPRNHEGQLGYWVIEAIDIQGGEALWVVRGWMPVGVAEKIGLAGEASAKNIVLVWGSLRAWSDPDRSQTPRQINGVTIWPALSPADFAAFPDAIALKGRGLSYPYILFAEGQSAGMPAGLEPVPVAANLRNNHRQYALFWFGCAGIMMGLALYVGWRGFRRPSPQEGH